ncbi:MAG TPA: glycosyltransferase family 2 protein [bacterium]
MASAEPSLAQFSSAQPSSAEPRLSVIIPHLKGVQILRDCLKSLLASEFREFEVILIDNASSDGSREMTAAEFPTVRQHRLEENRGYAGGCNAGIEIARGQYILLLNDDTVLEPDSLGALVAALDRDPGIAFAQPKLLNIRDRRYFDYSGACGGLLDVLGYPFAFGRTFMCLEEDRGQFDSASQIFWACGTAALYRRRALDEVGYLDSDFFAHMEEIDLAWRLHLAGYRGVRVPEAVVYHYSGNTLPNTERRKMFLNHRNSLACLLKNYSLFNLLWVLPLKIFFEWGVILISFFRGDWRRGPAALAVQIQLPVLLIQFLKKRRQVQSLRRVRDRQVMNKMYRGSVVLQHFLFGKRETRAILHRLEL